jgi:hypothetical protein
MYTSLFYKEWVKARRPLLLLLLAFVAVIAYILLNEIKQVQAAPVILWETVIQNSAVAVGYMKFLPLGAGVLLAIVQFLPEMQNKRLKLTLHLPLDEFEILCSISGFGLFLLSSLFAVADLTLLAGLRIYFCSEIVFSNFTASLPWFLGGLAAYPFAAWICLEPVWKQRILNLIPALCCLSFFYIKGLPGAYSPFILSLLVLIATVFFFQFYSAIRFKHGVQ